MTIIIQKLVDKEMSSQKKIIKVICLKLSLQTLGQNTLEEKRLWYNELLMFLVYHWKHNLIYQPKREAPFSLKE